METWADNIKMTFWRKHTWEDRGLVPKGNLLLSGIFEGEGGETFITTKSDAVKYECLKCGDVVNIIGFGRPGTFGCEVPNTRCIY